MEKPLGNALAEVERELQRFPQSVLQEFHRVQALIKETLDDERLLRWAQEGVSTAQHTVRSWEAAVEYFRVSPEVLRFLPFEYFVQWAQAGGILCSDSPTLSASYFKASPAAIPNIKPRHVAAWAALGRSLYKGNWKSSTVSIKFFETSPTLLKVLTFPELERFVSFLDVVSHRSYDLACECLHMSQEVFLHMGPDKDAFTSLATAMVEGGWREVKALFEAGAKAIPRVEKGQRGRFLRLAERLVEGGDITISTFVVESANALGQLEADTHPNILSLSEALLYVSPKAVPEFLKSCPAVLSRITVAQLESWFEEGVRILGENSDGGVAYFKVESARSEEVLEALSSGIELDRVKNIMRMYCQALAGASVSITASEELVGKNIGWVSKEKPTTEGTKVYLPSLVDMYPTKAENFSWFKVVSTHQVAHLEFGSFDYAFERPSLLFKDLRHKVESGKVAPSAGEPSPVADGSAERGWINDMQRFFNLFGDRRLALDIFTVVEDGRLDARIKVEYPGIKNPYENIQRDTLVERPAIESLPMREAIVEFLVRLSLQQYRGLPAPQEYVQEAKTIARIARRLLSRIATVEDCAEAALRIYAIISQIPNEEIPPEEWESLDMDQDEEYMDAEDMEQMVQQVGQPMSMELGEMEQEYSSPQEVEYRGEFKPEMGQLMAQLKMQQGQGESTEPISKEMLEELLRNTAELELDAVEGEIQKTTGLFANNIMRELGVNLPPNQDFNQGSLGQPDEEGEPLESSDPQTFLYDEWDFRAEDYKPRWCMVREKTLEEGEAQFYTETLGNYSSLVSHIRRQFELMVPETYRKVKRLPDGEEFDLDSVIEAFVDKRTGNSPSEKVYWRRNKVHRDVAVVFLLDMSASTAEAIDETKRLTDDWDAPDDPVEYMVWLRTRRGQGVRRTYKRIIDVEKESCVLLINALEKIGDLYGVYGFSGYGRENVEFYIIKDIEESFSDKVIKRIDRVAPLHATRMGPAIRHATSKLEKQDARTKVLFLISDGRPQDRGYSREGVEKEYAINDTKKAFDEARRADITPFCLTVDKAGHDYLKAMCQDMGYEVLADVFALPERLPMLYRRLTI